MARAMALIRALLRRQAKGSSHPYPSGTIRPRPESSSGTYPHACPRRGVSIPERRFLANFRSILKLCLICLSKLK